MFFCHVWLLSLRFYEQPPRTHAPFNVVSTVWTI
nr:MAG TPA: hypothetical protein [Caudoviricetes sp.]